MSPNALQIRNVARFLAPTTARIRLSILRSNTWLDRPTFDTALLELERQGIAILYPLDNPIEITPDDIRAALPNSAGFARHIVYFG